MGAPMRRLFLLMSLSSCVSQLSMLEPRPNLAPQVGGASVSLVLGNSVQQQTRLFRVSLDSFRGDLKRGFLNGYPGAVANGGDLQLVLDSVEPSYVRVDGNCVATLRYRGRLMNGDEVLQSFAATARSEQGDFRRCFKTGIEALYEQVFAKLSAEAPSMRSPPDAGLTPE